MNGIDFYRRDHIETGLLKSETHSASACEKIDTDRPRTHSRVPFLYAYVVSAISTHVDRFCIHFRGIFSRVGKLLLIQSIRTAKRPSSSSRDRSTDLAEGYRARGSLRVLAPSNRTETWAAVPLSTRGSAKSNRGRRSLFGEQEKQCRVCRASSSDAADIDSQPHATSAAIEARARCLLCQPNSLCESAARVSGCLPHAEPSRSP